MAIGTLMTAAQFDALPVADGRRTELIDGEIVEVSSATFLHNRIQAMLIHLLLSWLKPNTRGMVLPNTEFAFGEDRFQPDIAIFSSDRWREWDQGKLPVSVAPDIAVEIISPSESAYHVDHKLRSYLKHGVKEVWLVYTEEPHIYVHTTESIQRLEHNHTLTTPQLPGWSLVVGDAFSL